MSAKLNAVQFLQNTVAYFRSLGVLVKRILTDNGSAFRSKVFRQACQTLELKHSFTRAYRPQTNGKAERFIQSALREWAYGIAYNHSSERQRCSTAGCTTTTGTGHTKASKAWHRSAA